MTTSTDTTATIRGATPEDLAAIERLLSDASLPTDGVADIMRTDPENFFVAEVVDRDKAIVGVGGLEVCNGDALLRSVAVRPEWRTHGLGQELVRRIVCHAESRGIRALYLLTTTAEHYFPRFGFERIERGTVPSEIAETLEFKSACPETATAMRKALV
jgi:amino-acid N-acetyltransferase